MADKTQVSAQDDTHRTVRIGLSSWLLQVRALPPSAGRPSDLDWKRFNECPEDLGRARRAFS
jgi:hypothetical protein